MCWCHAIIIPAKGSASVNADAIKTSTGALYNIPVCKEGNLVNVIKDLQSAESQFLVLLKNQQNLFMMKIPGSVAIVMGSEEDGVWIRLFKISDKIIRIAWMAGQTASPAMFRSPAGAILYEAVRQRMLQDLFKNI